MEYQNGYEQVGVPQIPPAPKQKLGFAIASLVLGLVSIICICCGLQIITGPLALIFGFIALCKRHDGTGMSITGIATASLSLLLTLVVLITNGNLIRYAGTMLEDFSRVLEEQDEVFPAYAEDGTLPDYLKKYTESPYQEFLASYDSSIYVIMDALLENYKNGELPKPGEGFSNTHTSSAMLLPCRLTGSQILLLGGGYAAYGTT